MPHCGSVLSLVKLQIKLISQQKIKRVVENAIGITVRLSISLFTKLGRAMEVDDVESLPSYSEVPLAHVLYFSKPTPINEGVVTSVSTIECPDFHTTLFIVEESKFSGLDAFKVYASGMNVDPDVLDDHYYAFILVPEHSKIKSRSAHFRIHGGRGHIATPSQVSPYPAFMDVGQQPDGRTFARFRNPFKSFENMQKKEIIGLTVVKGSTTLYEWQSILLEDDSSAQVFHLDIWEENVGPKKVGSERTFVAEFCVGESGATLNLAKAEFYWSSMEECAFIVGTAYGALLASKTQKPSPVRSSVSFV